MNGGALLDAHSSNVLGFDWLLEAVAPLSPYGQSCFEQVRPFAPGEESRAQARADAIARLAGGLSAERLAANQGVLRALPDVSSAVARASMGDLLADPDFLELRRFCESAETLDVANDATRTVCTALETGRSAGAEFYLADAFDPQLAAARQNLSAAQAELESVRGRESEAIARTLAREEIAGDEFIVMRADLHGHLPVGVRVVREAPTYLLCALEYGEAARAALARRDAAAQEVAAAEERVRATLSAIVRRHAVELNAVTIAVGELDVLLAAVRFTQRYDCTPAQIAEYPTLAYESGRFIPLEEELARDGRAFVALDLDLHETAVLTGPNMGGKSVTLQTCGFLALCAAFGLPVPSRRARIGLFERIAWLGSGREERAGGLLSSFAREVLALKEILDGLTARVLVLADEFARTTTPHEAKALLVALIARLKERGACGLLATHLEGIAAAAGVRHYAVRGLRSIPERAEGKSLQDALAALAASMDFTITEVTGDARPRADAIALSALLGLDAAFVEEAYRALAQ